MAYGARSFECLLAAGCLLLALESVQAQAACGDRFGAGCARCTLSRCTAVTDEGLFVLQNGKAVFQAGVEPGPSGKGRACRPGSRKVKPGKFACEPCAAISKRSYTPFFRSKKCKYCSPDLVLSADRTACTAPDCSGLFGAGCGECTAAKCTAVSDSDLYVIQGVKAVLQAGVEPGPSGKGRACRPGSRKVKPGKFACEPCAAVSTRSYTDKFRSKTCKTCPSNNTLSADRTSCTSRPLTAAPTTAPTRRPTTAPTKWPTTAPTDQPTAAPTEAPTDQPTAAPTEAPTAAPTNADVCTGVSNCFNGKILVPCNPATTFYVANNPCAGRTVVSDYVSNALTYCSRLVVNGVRTSSGYVAFDNTDVLDGGATSNRCTDSSQCTRAPGGAICGNFPSNGSNGFCAQGSSPDVCPAVP